MTRPEIGLISPCFIVSDAPRALAFYHDRLGFEITHQEPSEAPFFGIVQRGGAMLMLKDVGIPAMPNLKRHEWQRWDAYLYVPDPDALAAEFESRQVQFLQLSPEQVLAQVKAFKPHAPGPGTKFMIGQNWVALLEDCAKWSQLRIVRRELGIHRFVARQRLRPLRPVRK